MRELSKKKPDLVMSAPKVQMINRILRDVAQTVANEPQAAYLELLDEDTLPTNSDALFVMVQHEAALSAFKNNHFNFLSESWLTSD